MEIKELIDQLFDELRQVSFRVDNLQNALHQKQQESISELSVRKAQEEIERLKKIINWHHDRLETLEKKTSLEERVKILEKEIVALKESIEEDF